MTNANKSGKSFRKRLAALTRNNDSKKRIHIEKHAKVMEYLYNAEQMEIDIMIETINRMASKEKTR